MSGWEDDVALAEDAAPQGTFADQPAEMMEAQQAGWALPTKVDYGAAQSKEPVQPILLNEARYEFNGDIGDIGPKVPQLEEQLYNTKHRVSVGDKLDTLMIYDVTQEGPVQTKPIFSFKGAGLHPVMEELIDLCGYPKPTPIQAYTIPAVTHGSDLIAVAQTGSGKTAAYLIPIISRLMGKAKKWAAPRPNPITYNAQTDAVRAEPLVLIMCPTRELAMQIFDETRRFCYRSMLRPAVVYGGSPRRPQLDDLKRGADILIGTPGRLRDFVETEPRWLSLNRLKYTVLDEADEMIQADWEEQMKSILGGAASNLNEDHHFMMFSATFNKDSRELARKYLEDDHIRIRVGRTGSVHGNIAQDVIWVDEDQKQEALKDLLMAVPPCRTLIFCNANPKCDTIDDFLYNRGFPVTSTHSGRTQFEREDALRSFRQGKCPIMVTSNVSARGLDVKNIMHVINYDLPSTQHGGIDEYVHRVGRTARIGNQGQSTSFYNERNEDLAPKLVNTLLETNQTVPDFLEQYKHESGKAVFDDDESDHEDGDGGAANGGADGGWGAPATSTTFAETNNGWDQAQGTATDSWAPSSGAQEGW